MTYSNGDIEINGTPLVKQQKQEISTDQLKDEIAILKAEMDTYIKNVEQQVIDMHLWEIVRRVTILNEMAGN